jgi:hypothetical protein
MMCAAAFAAQSDPLLNRNINRRWIEPPPLERRTPSTAGTVERLDFFGNNSAPRNSRSGNPNQARRERLFRAAERLFAPHTVGDL